MSDFHLFQISQQQIRYFYRLLGSAFRTIFLSFRVAMRQKNFSTHIATPIVGDGTMVAIDRRASGTVIVGPINRLTIVTLQSYCSLLCNNCQLK